MKNINKRYFENPKQYIPKGCYCYSEKGVCPFWDSNPKKEHQENGYCHYLREGDWMNERFGLLWDQVKECGINE